MSLPNNLSAYDDCEEAYQKALADNIGYRVLIKDYPMAHMFQLRLHQYRALLRVEAKRMYATTDPQWGKCEFDCLKVRKPVETAEGDGWWVYIVRHGQEIVEGEALSEVEVE